MHIAFVLLQEPRAPEATAVARAFHEMFAAEPECRPAAAPSEIAEIHGGPGLTSFVALVPTPVPAGEAEAAAQYSVGALAADSADLTHSAHFIVTTILGEVGAVESLTHHCRVVAAVVSAYRAVAVYDGAARATHLAEFYLAAVSADEHPIQVWSGVSVAPERGERLSFLTLGLGRFELPNLLVTSSIGDAAGACNLLLNLALYTVERGEEIPDGDTVGRSEHERVVVAYRPSPIEGDGPVAGIELP